MDESITYATVLVAGILAGLTNTIAGGGSFVSLPALMAMGLSPGVANASNRIAIFFQSGVASCVYARAGKLEWRRGLSLAAIAGIGAALGAGLAASLADAVFERIFGALFVVMSLALLFKRHLGSSGFLPKSKPRMLVVVVFVIIGFYGGFLQAGVGILMLLAFSVVLDWEIVAANGIKNFVVFLYTAVALLVFAQKGLIDYQAGLLLALGNVLGGYVGAKWSLGRGQKWVLRIVVLVAFLSGIRLLFKPLS